MRRNVWGKSVEIQVGAGAPTRRSVATTHDAARLLLDTWPGRRGTAFKMAVKDCTLALRGEIPHDAVAIRLADALREAGVDCVLRDADDFDPFFEAEIAQVCIESLREDMIIH